MTEFSNMQAETSRVSRLRNRGLCGLMAAGATAILAAAPLHTANASIVYSGVVNITVTAPSPAAYGLPDDENAIDVNIDPADTFSLMSINDAKQGTATLFQSAATGLQFLTNGNGSNAGVSDVGNNFTVDGTSPYAYFNNVNVNGPITLVAADTRTGGGFAPGSDGYFGFQINPTGSQVDYGWAQLTISGDALTATIVDFAYDDSGAAIVTPGVSVPEPASMSVIGLGSLALLGRRRRRSSNA